jgi:hypothetical protein
MRETKKLKEENLDVNKTTTRKKEDFFRVCTFLYDQISVLSTDDSVAKLKIGAQISVIGKLLTDEGQFIKS